MPRRPTLTVSDECVVQSSRHPLSVDLVYALVPTQSFTRHRFSDCSITSATTSLGILDTLIHSFYLNSVLEPNQVLARIITHDWPLKDQPYPFSSINLDISLSISFWSCYLF